MLKGLALADISTVHKEEGLSWHKFSQFLIEQYSNVPYVPDAMFAYSKICQWDDESITQYLVRVKILLERIHQTSKLLEIYRVWHGQLVAHLWPAGNTI